MPVTIITLPPEECALANIYRYLSKFGDTEKMKKKYQKALQDHLKWCKTCKYYDEYKRNKNEHTNCWQISSAS